MGDIPLVWEKQFTRFADKAPERLEAFDDYNDQFDGEFSPSKNLGPIGAIWPPTTAASHVAENQARNSTVLWVLP